MSQRPDGKADLLTRLRSAERTTENRELLADAIDEIELQRKILNRLPVSMDGVYIVPGIPLWYRGVEFVADSIAFQRSDPTRSMNPAYCYANQESDEKARRA
jgi:hypothetical protein